MRTSKWLGGRKNGTGDDAPTWNTEVATQMRHPFGDHTAKPTLLANLKKQLGLPAHHSFVANCTIHAPRKRVSPAVKRSYAPSR